MLFCECGATGVFDGASWVQDYDLRGWDLIGFLEAAPDHRKVVAWMNALEWNRRYSKYYKAHETALRHRRDTEKHRLDTENSAQFSLI